MLVVEGEKAGFLQFEVKRWHRVGFRQGRGDRVAWMPRVYRNGLDRPPNSANLYKLYKLIQHTPLGE